MAQTGTAVRAAIENKMKAALREEITTASLMREINDYGKLTFGLVLVIDKDTGDLIHGRIVTGDELAGYALMYEGQLN